MTENNDILNRLQKLETHLINLNIALQNANHLVELLDKPLSVDDRHLAYILTEIKKAVWEFQEQSKKMDISQTFSEIKFIGKRLDSIEKDISEMKEQGIKKNIHLDLTLDGYEMVKKQTIFKEKQPGQTQTQNQDEVLIEALNTLTEREAKCLTHRFGLLRHKPKTLIATAKEMGLKSGSAARVYEIRALRKLRINPRKEKSLKITHKKLREALFGNSENDLD